MALGNLQSLPSLFSMKGSHEMGWMVLICLTALVVAAAADAGLAWPALLPW